MGNVAYCAVCSDLGKREARFARWTRRGLPCAVDTGSRSILHASSVAICQIPRLELWRTVWPRKGQQHVLLQVSFTCKL